MKSTYGDTRATDSIIRSGQKNTEKSISNICVVFECGRQESQSSTLPLSVHPTRGEAVDRTFKIDISVPLGPVFN